MRIVNWLLAVAVATLVGSVAIAAQDNGEDTGSSIGGPQEPPCDLPGPPARGRATTGHPMPSTASPKGKISDIMNSMMVPSSNTVWNAVGVSTDATGVHESRPETDEEWNKVFHAAVQLAEVSNLLLVPGRERCVGGAIPPQYRVDFGRKAREMQEAANIAIIAARKHDADGLAEAGERIDVACDACHEKYQIAKGDPENWKKVLGTYTLTPDERAAAAQAKSAPIKPIVSASTEN
jgi:hypothetical protein